MKEIQLTQGRFALVDDVDFEWLNQFSWSARFAKNTGTYYAIRNSKTLDGKRHITSMHRQILGLEYGDPRKGDHHDHNTLNNQRNNLRIAGESQSCCNRRRFSNNTSGFKGVYRDGSRGKWNAIINVGGIAKFLGTFGEKVAAAQVYDEAAIQLHGEFAVLNFPKEDHTHAD